VDTLERPGERWSAAMKVLSDGHKKGFLWIGLNGKVVAKLNGETVMTERSVTTFRVGQFQHPVQLRPGENTLVFDVEAQGAPARLSAMVTGPRNDGDTLEGIRYV
jgi:hypothetical protein